MPGMIMGDWMLAGCGGTMVSGELRTVLVGAVGPGCEQFMAQHSLAAAADGVSSCARASLQQLIISDCCSPECIGKPASALPARAMTRIKAVNHLIIGSCNYIERPDCLSR